MEQPQRQTNRTPSPANTDRSVFVGRQREMAQLRAALDDALSSQGRLVMLVGEPGIGKTRTAQALAHEAEARGARAIWGRCYQGEGVPPYWPWVQAIRLHLREVAAEELGLQMGVGAADIAQIVPEIRGKLPGLEPLPHVEPEAARFRLFESIASFLFRAAQSRPLVLVLDDLHWADRSSLLLLQFLAREVSQNRLLLVGTYRDFEVSRQHPLHDTMARLSRETGFQRLLLGGFSQEDAGRFIEASTGASPSRDVVQAVYRRSEGNPFFMGEIIRLMAEQGRLTEANINGPLHMEIPVGILEVIGQRLNRLSSECNQALSIAATIGREFDFRLLAGLADGPGDTQLLNLIDEALGAHLVEGVAGEPERYQFTHALVQETLIEAMSASRRVRWHARIAQALERLYQGDIEAHAAELARHFAEAQTALGTEKLVRYSLLAGEGALATYAWEEALAHFQRGLVAQGIPLTDGVPAPDAEAARLLFGLGLAQAATFETHEMSVAMASLGRAFDFYAATGDVDRAVAVAEYPLFAPSFPLTGAPQLVARALAMVPPESHTAGRLQSRYGWFLGMEQGDYEGARDAFTQALAIAQRESDSGLAMRTLANAAEVEAYYNHSQESLRNGLQAVALANQVDDPHAELLARYWTSFRQIIAGESSAASQHAAAMLGLAERMRHHFYLARTLFVNEALSRLKGEWQTARGFSDRGLTLSPREPRLLAARLVLEFELGNFGEGEAHLERLLEVVQITAPGPTNSYAIAAMMIPAVSRITGAANRLDESARFTEDVLTSPSATPLIGMIARIGAALTAVVSGDINAARAQYPALESQRGTTMVFLIVADRLLGLLASTMGQHNQAVAHFEDALAFCRKAGYRPELAWSCCDYADTLLQRKGPGDRQKAMFLLDESLRISRELGMRPLAERVQAHRQRADS